ncbi:MAG: LysR family transcriptional regulator [Pseudomonadota bacterium]
MNLRSVDLNLLTIFDAVMTERNISKAAEKISMSQPAVSAALSRLRIVLNDDLFVRTSHGVKPTPRAFELERPIRTILNLVSDTVLQAREFDPSTSDRVFSLASVDYAGIVLVPFLARYFEEIGAGARLKIWPQYERDIRELMHFGTVDLALDNIPIVDDDFQVHVVRREPAFFLARKNHPTLDAGSSLEQVLETPSVVLYPRSERLSLFDQHLLSLGLKRKRGIMVPSIFNMPYIVAETDMICTLPESIALELAKKFELDLYPVPIGDWLAPLYLIWHSSLDGDLGHQWFRNTIIEHFK